MCQNKILWFSLMFCFGFQLYASRSHSSAGTDQSMEELVVVGRACVPRPFVYNQDLFAQLRLLEREYALNFSHMSDYLLSPSVDDLHRVVRNFEQASFQIEQAKRKFDMLYDELSCRYNQQNSRKALQQAYADITYLKSFYDQLYLAYRYKGLIMPWQSNVDVDQDQFMEQLKNFVYTTDNPLQQLRNDHRLSTSDALRHVLQTAIASVRKKE